MVVRAIVQRGIEGNWDRTLCTKQCNSALFSFLFFFFFRLFFFARTHNGHNPLRFQCCVCCAFVSDLAHPSQAHTNRRTTLFFSLVFGRFSSFLFFSFLFSPSSLSSSSLVPLFPCSPFPLLSLSFFLSLRAKRCGHQPRPTRSPNRSMSWRGCEETPASQMSCQESHPRSERTFTCTRCLLTPPATPCSPPKAASTTTEASTTSPSSPWSVLPASKKVEMAMIGKEDRWESRESRGSRGSRGGAKGGGRTRGEADGREAPENGANMASQNSFVVPCSLHLAVGLFWRMSESKLVFQIEPLARAHAHRLTCTCTHALALAQHLTLSPPLFCCGHPSGLGQQVWCFDQPSFCSPRAGQR